MRRYAGAQKSSLSLRASLKTPADITALRCQFNWTAVACLSFISLGIRHTSWALLPRGQLNRRQRQRLFQAPRCLFHVSLLDFIVQNEHSMLEVLTEKDGLSEPFSCACSNLINAGRHKSSQRFTTASFTLLHR